MLENTYILKEKFGAKNISNAVYNREFVKCEIGATFASRSTAFGG